MAQFAIELSDGLYSKKVTTRVYVLRLYICDELRVSPGSLVDVTTPHIKKCDRASNNNFEQRCLQIAIIDANRFWLKDGSLNLLCSNIQTIYTFWIAFFRKYQLRIKVTPITRILQTYASKMYLKNATSSSRANEPKQSAIIQFVERSTYIVCCPLIYSQHQNFVTQFSSFNTSESLMMLLLLLVINWISGRTASAKIYDPNRAV